MLTYTFAFLIGIISSITGALLGIGGGIVIVPALVILMKVHIHNAIAISLATIVSTSVLVTASNMRNNLVNLEIGMMLELFTSLFAIIASFVAISINPSLLKAAFGFFLLFTAYFMYKRPEPKINTSGKGKFSYFDERLGKTIFYDVEHPVAAISISSAAGFLSGLLGIGGGIIKVPILNGVCQIPMKVASATSAMMVGITAAVASYIYLRHGYMNYNYVLFTSLGAIAGSRIGLFIAKRVKNETIKILFVGILLSAAAEMIVKALLL